MFGAIVCSITNFICTMFTTSTPYHSYKIYLSCKIYVPYRTYDIVLAGNSYSQSSDFHCFVLPICSLLWKKRKGKFKCYYGTVRAPTISFVIMSMSRGSFSFIFICIIWFSMVLSQGRIDASIEPPMKKAEQPKLKPKK